MRRNPEPVPPAVDVPERLVEGLQLVPVRNPAQSAVWNELMITEHPLGKAVLVGCRYLVDSSHGWLGAVGFAASARRLAARDNWIGWDDDRRRTCLHRVACMSRFLPGVECRNLASQVLSMSLTTMARDFEERYGHRPWLVETFVDPALGHLAPRGELESRRRNSRTRTAGPERAGGRARERDIHVRARTGLPGGTKRPAGRPGSGRRGVVARVLGRERVRRCTVGRQASGEAPGRQRPCPGGSAVLWLCKDMHRFRVDFNQNI